MSRVIFSVYDIRSCSENVKFVSFSSELSKRLNTSKMTRTKKQNLLFTYENLQMKLLKMIDKYYIVNPVKNRCRQINVVEFSI